MLTKQNANFHIIMTSKEKFNQNYGRIDIIFNTFEKKKQLLKQLLKCSKTVIVKKSSRIKEKQDKT